jgi:hypothetical protein
MPGTLLGRGNILYDFLIGVSLTPVAVAGANAVEQSFTVLGFQVGDFVDAQCTVAQTSGIGIGNCRISAANTLTIEFVNSTAGSLTPAAGIYNVNVSRPENTVLPTNAF